MDNFTEIFDSSTVKNYTKDEFIAEIVPLIQDILKQVFPNNVQKQKVQVLRNRICFAAPCCGDSATQHHKKRGNIILDGKYSFMYKCFNCGTYMSVNDFLERYNKKLSLGTIGYISQQRQEIVTHTFDSSLASSIYDIDTIESLSMDREWFKKSFDLVECTMNHKGRNYLLGRRQFDMTKFLYSIKTDKLFILNLTPSGKIFGMQVRRFDGGPKYKTYSLQKIHELIIGDDITIPDDINTISMLFNILLISYNAPVTVVEGPMDSFLIKNSIALCGAGKNMKFPFDHRYMFDDDVTGKQHAIDMLNGGYRVFLWEKYKKEVFAENRKKWDFNDLLLYCYSHKVIMPDIDAYFSDNILDIVNL